MADRRVKVTIDADVSGFEKGAKAAGKATEGLAKSTEQAAKSTEQLGKSGGSVDGLRGKLSQLADESSKVGKAAQDIVPALTGIGVVGAAGFAKAVTTAASFDKAMSNVQAATHETAGNMALLSEAAITAGADTAFSAEEAAGAIEELSKAGVSTTDVLNGGLNGALALAAAGELDVAKAAEIAASAMTQFGLSGGDIPHIADLLAAGAGKAQGSVEDLGNALNQAGLIANSTGLTIEETTGGLAAFASAGLTGSDAGTSFKSMLQRLTPQSDAAAKTMEELGLSAYDSQGEFIGLSEYAGLLQEKLAGMSSEQRNATMQTLFGADAVRAANVLYEQGAEGIENWEEAVSDAGYAAETAAIMQDNLAGDLEKLGGAFDTVFLQAGTGANEALRGLVQGLEGIVDTIGQLPTPVLQGAAAMSGLVGAAGLMGAGFITAVPKIKETRDALQTLAPAGTKASKVIGAVGTAAAGLAAAGAAVTVLTTLYNSSRDAAPAVEEVANALLHLQNSGDSAALDSKFDFSGITTHVNGFGDALKRIDLDNPIKHIQSFGDTVFGQENVMSQSRDTIMALDDALAGMDASGAAEQMNALRIEAESVGRMDLSSWSELQRVFPEYAAAVEAAANATGVATSEADLFQAAMGNLPPHMQAVAEGGEAAGAGADAAGEGAAGAAEGIDDMSMSAEDAAEHLEDMLDSLRALGVVERDARAASRDYQAAIDDIASSLKDNGKTLDENTEKGRANAAALDGLAQAGLDSAAAMAENGAGHEQLRGQLQGTYDQLVSSAQGFGMSKAKADEYARSILGIPDNVDVKTFMDEKAKEVADATGAEIASIQESVNVITSMDTAAQDQAFKTADSVKAIPGFKKVDVAVSDAGTPGQIQQRINKITGKTEYVFVTEDGTTATVQQKIVNIDGVSRTVYVDDDGTIYATQGEINGIRGKDVDVVAVPHTSNAEAQLNHTARDRHSRIIATTIAKTIPDRTSMLARPVPRKALGGRLPYTGLGTDQIVGIGSHGRPTAMVDDGEWVIRERSARKYDRLLAAVNADAPAVQHLAGYARGGAVGREWSGPAVAPFDYSRFASVMGGQRATSSGMEVNFNGPIGYDPREVAAQLDMSRKRAMLAAGIG